MPTRVEPRVAIVDHHPISRCAYCALLRSEGVDVVADLSPSDGAALAIETLAPDLVIVDVTADAGQVAALLERIRPLPCALMLTSSGPRPADLDGFAFVPKTDICRATILAHLGRGSERHVRFGRALGTSLVLDGSRTGGRFAVVEHDLPPRQLGAPVHTHSREDEFTYVMAGRITVMLGDAVFEAGSGHLVPKPRGIPHAIWNAADEPGRFLELISPAGFESYFVELAEAFGDQAQMLEIEQRYGLSVRAETVRELIESNGLDLPF